MTINDYSNYVYVPDEVQNVGQVSPLEKIAASKEISRASEDPVLLAISDYLNYNVSGLTQSLSNASSAASYLNIADNALQNQSEILDSIREKLQQASTDTTSDDGRRIIKNEINDLLSQFDNIASSTNYNGETLLQRSPNDSSQSEGLTFQAGTNSNDTISSNAIQSNLEGLGLKELFDDNNLTSESARNYLDTLDQASLKVSDYLSNIGSVSGQLESSYTNLSSQVVNNSSALAAISNIDYSKEVASFSKQNILAQVGSFAQSQANNINQHAVLKHFL